MEEIDLGRNVMSANDFKYRPPHVELRTGVPYANLIANQAQFSQALGKSLDIDPNDVIPMAGTMGAIEAVRNHVLKNARGRDLKVLTVSPGYWRARESFEGMGFKVSDVRIETNGFTISETEITSKIMAEEPELVYLSLPNNPTGAVFNPEDIVKGAPEKATLLFDVTLPSRKFDSRALSTRLYSTFRGRKNLFVAGSTSKSHNTAELRVGWLICANSDDARDLRRENRNVVASMAIQHAMDLMGKTPTALEMIDMSFSLLKEGEKPGNYTIIRPEKMTQSVYVLVRVRTDVKRVLAEKGIAVMWGSEYGLSDEYIRLETLEPSHIGAFVDAVNSYPSSSRLANRIHADRSGVHQEVKP
jgi:aspartate/methionine/tyrosine aminotransferase